MSEHDVRWNRYPGARRGSDSSGLACDAGRVDPRQTHHRNIWTVDGRLPAIHGAASVSGLRRPRASIWPCTCAICWRARVRASRRSCISTLVPDYPMRPCCCDCRSSACLTTILCLMAFGRRILTARMHWRRRHGRWPGDAPLVRRHRKLPWIPTEGAVASDSGGDATESRLGIARCLHCRTTRPCVARRSSASTLAIWIPRIDWCAYQPRTRRTVASASAPYAKATARLLAAYLELRRQVTRDRGLLFVSFSHRNLGRPISVWAWAKTITNVALVSGVGRFTTHTLRHLCRTDLARAGWDIQLIAAFARGTARSPARWSTSTSAVANCRPSWRRRWTRCTPGACSSSRRCGHDALCDGACRGILRPVALAAGFGRL